MQQWRRPSLIKSVFRTLAVRARLLHGRVPPLVDPVSPAEQRYREQKSSERDSGAPGVRWTWRW